MQVSNKKCSYRRSVFLFISLFMLITHYPLLGKSRVLFSPDDHPTTHLINAINEAKWRIYAAIYMLTDKNIAYALANAKEKRGVDVQVVVDVSSVDSSYGKTEILRDGGIKLFVFNPTGKTGRFRPLMHNKFAILDNKVWTGSFNWTISANQRNQENVIITDEKEVKERFLSHFYKLKNRCWEQKPKRRRTRTKKDRTLLEEGRSIIKLLSDWLTSLFD